MSNDWDDDWGNMEMDFEFPKEKEIIPDIPRYCFHEWKPILLIINTVYNCAKCDKKKEEL